MSVVMPVGGLPTALAARALRLGAAMGMIALGGLLMAHHAAVRDLEATLAAVTTGWATGTDTASAPGHQVFLWLVGTPSVRGLTVTPECTSAFIAGPILVVGGVLALSRRLPIPRLLTGVSLAVLVVLAVNVARLTLIAFATYEWGPQRGFWWSHVIAGSIVTIAGTIAGLGLLLLYATRQREEGGRG